MKKTNILEMSAHPVHLYEPVADESELVISQRCKSAKQVPPKIFSASTLSANTGTKLSALIAFCANQFRCRSLKILRVLSEISMIGQSATMRHGWNLLSRLATLANRQLTLIRYWFI